MNVQQSGSFWCPNNFSRWNTIGFLHESWAGGSQRTESANEESHWPGFSRQPLSILTNDSLFSLPHLMASKKWGEMTAPWSHSVVFKTLSIRLSETVRRECYHQNVHRSLLRLCEKTARRLAETNNQKAVAVLTWKFALEAVLHAEVASYLSWHKIQSAWPCRGRANEGAQCAYLITACKPTIAAAWVWPSTLIE